MCNCQWKASRFAWVPAILVIAFCQNSLAATALADHKTNRDRSGKAAGTWLYTSNLGFSLRLPSKSWKTVKIHKQFLVNFWTTWYGAPMIVGISSAKKQSKEEFQKSFQSFRKEYEKAENLLAKPVSHQGVNPAKQDYAYVTMYEKGRGKLQYIFVGKCYTWLKDPGITVEIIFEGQGKMLSKRLRAAESKAFEEACKSIFLSVAKTVEK